jgi:hypothetical protein
MSTTTELTGAHLAKARAFADRGEFTTEAARWWIRSLVDHAERVSSRLVVLSRSEQAAMADATRLQEERDAAMAALSEILGTVSSIVGKAAS